MFLNLDHTLYKLINQKLAFEFLDKPMTLVSDRSFWIVFYCVVIFLIVRQFKKKGMLFLLFIILSSSLSDIISSRVLKPSFNRTRPCHETKLLNPRILETTACNPTGSLPSSHAANSFALAVMMILFYGVNKNSNTIFWLLWAGIISYSRVYLGVHYVSDVFVGAILGTLLSLVSFKLYKKTLLKLKWE